MSFFGKHYVLESQENFDDFITAFGDVPEEYKKAVAAHKATLEVTKNGDEYVLKTSQPTGGVKELTFKSGVEFDDSLNNVPTKTTITVDGNTITQAQRTDTGVTLDIKRVFNGDQLTTTITSSVSSKTAIRHYKAA